MELVSAPELAAWLADPSRDQPLLLDVRENWEFETCRIEGSVHMAMQSVPARIDELEEDAPIVCICHHGMRSMNVAAFLERNGFSRVSNLTGGVHAWATLVDENMARY